MTSSVSNASAPGDSETTEPVAPPHRSQRSVLLVLGVIAVLLTGFAAGLLVGKQQDSSQKPSAVDIGFSQDMSVHHLQAVEMSALAYDGSTDPAVKRLAYDILTTQENQAGRMQGWLQSWGEPQLSVGGYMGWMTDMSAHHHSGTAEHSGPVAAMPGMASTEELAALRQATGPALDIMFLQLMLRHHQGGMPMAEYAAQRADVEVVRSLADSMVKTQSSEATLMTQMLAERHADPLPFN
ncbi:DUF305 domain-containing protein [Nocardia sp. NBC_01503]|uniref:DUF305 domain-containing protein n=1 Tax=Nocardia sp. NBC_01503 TaxID=2975997 RepID=UPI002E7B62B9|nr:DUF305 domain-containing protein [Nocardia sp. NBC_01503]WTL33638.1 DUF305 domain-containing protein [Nocardia sp. NBC_01503]